MQHTDTYAYHRKWREANKQKLREYYRQYRLKELEGRAPAKKIHIHPQELLLKCLWCDKSFNYTYIHGRVPLYCTAIECIHDRKNYNLRNDSVRSHVRAYRDRRRVERDMLRFKLAEDNPFIQSWFSGLFDGEGHLGLKAQPYKSGGRAIPYICSATLTVRLRDDDTAILEFVRNFFNCGATYKHKLPGKSDGCDRKPQTDYVVGNTAALYHVFIPHFDEYPLMSKKVKDYEVWREGVCVIYERQHHSQKGMERFLELTRRIMEVRKYVPEN